MKLEVNEIELNLEHQFAIDKYPKFGIYLNKKTDNLLFVGQLWVLHLTDNAEKFLKEHCAEEEPYFAPGVLEKLQNKPSFTEDFVLKLIAVASNKVNPKDLI